MGAGAGAGHRTPGRTRMRVSNPSGRGHRADGPMGGSDGSVEHAVLHPCGHASRALLRGLVPVDGHLVMSVGPRPLPDRTVRASVPSRSHAKRHISDTSAIRWGPGP